MSAPDHADAASPVSVQVQPGFSKIEPSKRAKLEMHAARQASDAAYEKWSQRRPTGGSGVLGGARPTQPLRRQAALAALARRKKKVPGGPPAQACGGTVLNRPEELRAARLRWLDPAPTK